MPNIASQPPQLILHAGPMKTGTTYLQYILQNNRAALLQDGWDYPGPRENHQYALYNICGQDIPWMTERATNSYAKIGAQLIETTNARATNLVLSSEALASLTAEGIERLTAKIGRPDKVVFTIRPLEKVFPSAWQQELKSGVAIRLDDYFRDAQNDHHKEELTGFWRNYGYGRIVQNWKSVLNCDVIAIAVPKSAKDPDLLWNHFREATGLPQVSDCHVPSNSSNASLSKEMAEMLYLFNRDINKSKGLEAKRKRTEFLTKCVFPAAGLKAGNPIQLSPEQVEMLAQWNAQERDHLVAAADHIIGDL